MLDGETVQLTERAIAAWERIARAMEMRIILEQERVDREFPVRRIQEAKVGKGTFNVHASKEEREADDTPLPPFSGGYGPREEAFLQRKREKEGRSHTAPRGDDGPTTRSSGNHPSTQGRKRRSGGSS